MRTSACTHRVFNRTKLIDMRTSMCTHRVFEGLELLQKVVLQDAMSEAVDVAAQCVEFGAQHYHFPTAVQFEQKHSEAEQRHGY
jgi:hypothetical protein